MILYSIYGMLIQPGGNNSELHSIWFLVILPLMCSLQHKLSEENCYHVKSVELETKEKPFSVMINGDPSCMIENVTRLAHIWLLLILLFDCTTNAQSDNTTSSGRRQGQ